MLRNPLQALADRSILTKLIASLLLIVAPLYVINYMLYNIGVDKNRQEIALSLTSAIHSYHNILETEIVRLDNMLMKSARDAAVTQATIDPVTSTQAERTIFTLSVHDLMGRLQYSSQFVSSTIAFLPKIGQTISTSGQLATGTAQPLFDAVSIRSGPFIPYGGKLYMSAPLVPDAGDTRSQGLVLAMEMSTPNLVTYLSQLLSYNRGGAMLFDQGLRWQVSTDGDDGVQSAVRSYLAEQMHQQKNVGLGSPRFETIRLQKEAYHIVYEHSPKLNTTLVAYAPTDEIYNSLNVYHVLFYIMSIVSVIVILVSSYWVYRTIHAPLHNLLNGFRKVEFGNLNFALTPRNKDEFGYLYRRFNAMVENLNQLIHVAYEQKLLNQRSELKRLQSQINPHFLYNNFFVLQRLIRLGRKEQATQFTGYMGRYFHFITRNAEDEVSLQEDVQHARAYLDIQSVCYDSRISIVFGDIPPGMGELLVPRLLLQPVLENSFAHAFEKQLDEGRLSVGFAFERGVARIIADDNGKQLEEERIEALQVRLESARDPATESTGMLNVHRRLQLRFGERSGLVLSRSPLGGLRTEIRIDLNGEKGEQA
ncbi:sensor histidine kinase [Paenibacillus koleovorans]|uniref:sensor histidine kinase n=1 Tax=Paenibacillus koleovorans TaxID=121608 RepID=UPI000FD8475D|nr:histidine kinase [Paenibacillus koleovorans]